MELEPYTASGLQIRVFRDELIDERMYLILSGAEAVLVDPHVEEAALPYLEQAEHLHIFLTHEHYDHISGVNWLRAQKSCRVYASGACAASMERSPNSTVHFPLLFLGDPEKYARVKKTLKLPYVCRADVRLPDSGTLEIPPLHWRFWATKGHSPGGMSFLLEGNCLFPGDTLLGNGMELKSIGADKAAFQRSIESYRQLGDDILLFPGHGDICPLSAALTKAERFYPWI